jgi:hypothetical protein
MKPSHSLTHSLIWKSMSPYLLLGVFTPAKLGKKNEKNLFFLDATKSNPEHSH